MITSRPINRNDEQIRSSATIYSGSAVSTSIDASQYGYRGLAVRVPSGWVAGQIGFQVSASGLDWTMLRDTAGVNLSISGLVNNPTAVLCVAPPDVWAGGTYPYLRLVSFSGGAAQPSALPTAHTLWVSFLS